MDGQRGDKGEKGDVGERGATGATGATGPSGTQGPNSVTVGTLNHRWVFLTKFLLTCGPMFLGVVISLQGWQMYNISKAQGDIKALQAQQAIVLQILLDKTQKHEEILKSLGLLNILPLPQTHLSPFDHSTSQYLLVQSWYVEWPRTDRIYPSVPCSSS